MPPFLGVHAAALSVLGRAKPRETATCSGFRCPRCLVSYRPLALEVELSLGLWRGRGEGERRVQRRLAGLVVRLVYVVRVRVESRAVRVEEGEGLRDRTARDGWGFTLPFLGHTLQLWSRDGKQ